MGMVPRVLLVLLSALISFASPQVSNERSIIVGDNIELELDQYLDSAELASVLRHLTDVKREIVLWKTLFQEKINVVQISRGVTEERENLKPSILLVGNLHGNDAVGYSLLTTLMQYLAYNDGYDTRVSRLLNTTDIWIIPNMNPDGFNRSKEGCDPSTDIPYPELKNKKQPETKHVLDSLMRENLFVLSGNLQGGAIVANGAYHDSNYKAGPDDHIVRELLLHYADKNPMMRGGKACNRNFWFGITNELDWRKRSPRPRVLPNCFELTLYLSCCKYPPSAELPAYWHANVQSLLTLIENARRGVYGMVKDKKSGEPIRNFAIRVIGSGKEIKGSRHGEYWRPLPLGTYDVIAITPAAPILTQSVNLTINNTYVRLDFDLKRQGLYAKVKYMCKGEEINPTRPVTIRAREQATTRRVFNLTLNKDGYYYSSQLPLGAYDVIAGGGNGRWKSTQTVRLMEEEPYIRVDFELVMKKNTLGRIICGYINEC